MRAIIRLALCSQLLIMMVSSHPSSPPAADDEIVITAERVGPYANPQEAFPYYSLPFCKYDDADVDAADTDGTALSRQLVARLPSTFDTSTELSCTTEPLTSLQIRLFEKSVQHRWFFQFHINNDLPVWGMVGEL